MNYPMEDRRVFTEASLLVLECARSEARGLKHAYVGTGHFLLGLLSVERTVANKALKDIGLDLDKVRRSVAFLVESGVVHDEPYYTTRANEVLQMAIREAKNLGVPRARTADLLFAVIDINEGTAHGILQSCNVDFLKLRRKILALLRTGEYE